EIQPPPSGRRRIEVLRAGAVESDVRILIRPDAGILIEDDVVARLVRVTGRYACRHARTARSAARRRPVGRIVPGGVVVHRAAATNPVPRATRARRRLTIALGCVRTVVGDGRRADRAYRARTAIAEYTGDLVGADRAAGRPVTIRHDPAAADA